MSAETYANSAVYLGSDHAGYAMKCEIAEYLKSQGKQVFDLGCHSTASVDYPDFVRPVADKVLLETIDGSRNVGILICGSGIGISIAANKLKGIRCALCHDHYASSMTRKHNDANILAIGGRTTGIEIAKEMVDTFLTTSFEGNQHARRVAKLHQLEAEQ